METAQGRSHVCKTTPTKLAPARRCLATEHPCGFLARTKRNTQPHKRIATNNDNDGGCRNQVWFDQRIQAVAQASTNGERGASVGANKRSLINPIKQASAS
jgi:hypothetical protein